MSLTIYRLHCPDCGRVFEEEGDDVDLCFYGFICPSCGCHKCTEVGRR